jgi:peroxiredoxin
MKKEYFETVSLSPDSRGLLKGMLGKGIISAASGDRSYRYRKVVERGLAKSYMQVEPTFKQDNGVVVQDEHEGDKRKR